ncbi:MAG: GreA/GreB family elongation factor [bacterium]|nr:GreA/GreB family elongation factor [bacterium]
MQERRKIVAFSDTNNTVRVRVGSRVTIRFSDGMIEIYTIVEYAVDVDPGQGRISQKSPLGSALIGACPGDTRSFELPEEGTETVEVISVE